jgi:hypothetical protein
MFCEIHRVTTTPNYNPQPEFFRLPKAGQRDPHFGLCRTAYYDLAAAGAFRFAHLRKRGKLRGTTLIPFDQVREYLRGLMAEGRPGNE